LATLLSQLAKPTSQVATLQRPAVQRPVPLAGRHTVPHVPQLVALVCASTSQPLAGFMSQSRKPAAQVYVHVPLLHDATALGRAAHARPQVPQCATELRTSASQPFAGLLSQSPKPVVHAATWQRPAVHDGVALASIHT
jgi:hypothetical protein